MTETKPVDSINTEVIIETEVNPKIKKSNKGLIIIIVIILSLVCCAIVAILFALSFIAIDPAKNFMDARDAQRLSDVESIKNAVNQYASENNLGLSDFEDMPSCTITSTKIGTKSGMVNLTDKLVDAYITEIPFDPSTTLEYSQPGDTGYEICKLTDTTVKVSAPLSENGIVISAQ